VSAPRPPWRLWRVAVVGVGVLALALLTQQALAAQLGRWLAGVWVSTVEIVVRLIAPLFGG
jgi:hypothetical protein